jgi:hypothetical protein
VAAVEGVGGRLRCRRGLGNGFRRGGAEVELAEAASSSGIALSRSTTPYCSDGHREMAEIDVAWKDRARLGRTLNSPKRCHGPADRGRGYLRELRKDIPAEPRERLAGTRTRADSVFRLLAEQGEAMTPGRQLFACGLCGRTIDHRGRCEFCPPTQNNNDRDARGYGREHRRTRSRLLQSAFWSACPMCGEMMEPGQDLDLDHTVQHGDGGVGDRMTHASCNRSRGKGNG